MRGAALLNKCVQDKATKHMPACPWRVVVAWDVSGKDKKSHICVVCKCGLYV